MARTAQEDVTTPLPAATLYVALELSKSTWKLGFTTSRTQTARVRDVPARETQLFLGEIAEAKTRFGLAADAPVRSCYEAGRDGFWIHHFLEGHGIQNVVLEPASIEVDRRAKQVKTDRVDVQKLARLLVRHHEGEGVVRVVRVPPPEAEDERLLPRQLKRLKKFCTRLTNAMRAALIRHGHDLDPRRADYKKQLGAARQWDGRPLPPGLMQELDLLWDQFVLLDRQIKDLTQQQRKALRDVRRGTTEGTVAQQKAARLSELRGVGDTGAYILTTEFFAWREFKNRREVGALAGLTGTPFSSGRENRDQGISKAGNPRVRTLMVELAWCWLRFQPNSRTTRWFHDHVGKGGSRSRRKAIVAVARKLLVELWHYVEHGVVPAGADLKPASDAVAA
jgi:transposase